MTEPEVHATPVATAEAAEAAADRPRWGAFWVILVAMVLLLFTPLVAGVVFPAKPEQVLGVYERAMMHVEVGDKELMGGFIAPQGWSRDLEDGALGERASERTLSTQDGGVVVVASMRSGVESPEQLLRESAPVGAALVPVQPLEAAPLLTANLLEYDLAAGGGAHQVIAVCEALRNNTCMLFEVSIAATHAGADRDPLLPDVAAMVASTEVQP